MVEIIHEFEPSLVLFIYLDDPDAHVLVPPEGFQVITVFFIS